MEALGENREGRLEAKNTVLGMKSTSDKLARQKRKKKKKKSVGHLGGILEDGVF